MISAKVTPNREFPDDFMFRPCRLESASSLRENAKRDWIRRIGRGSAHHGTDPLSCRGVGKCGEYGYNCQYTSHPL